jgi:hypothetical protein
MSDPFSDEGASAAGQFIEAVHTEAAGPVLEQARDVGAQSVWSNPENDPNERESIAEKPDVPTPKSEGAVEIPNWQEGAIPPPDRTPISVDPTGATNAGDPGDGPNEFGYQVTAPDAAAPYTLAVNGVSTISLSDEFSLEAIETALNETSGPVGLDVSGDASQYHVSSDTAFELTGDGATVEAWPEVPEA